MDGDALLIKTFQRISTVGGSVSGYDVKVAFREPPHHLSTYTVIAISDKVAADKGLRRFICDMAALNAKNRK
jgi:hypothetical protein